MIASSNTVTYAPPLSRTARNAFTASRVPVFSLDRIYTRGFACRSTLVPRGSAWARMSDHLPFVAELEPE